MMKLLKVAFLLLAPALFVCLSSGGVAMALTPTTGAVVATPAPPSLQYNALESDTTIALITERTNFALPGSVPLDSDGTPRLYDQISDLTGGALPAGERVDIYILHFDPVGAPRTLVRVIGSVTFDRPIVGLALSRFTLQASDLYGAVGTAYPTTFNPNFREFELEGGAFGVSDTAQISADRRTLSLDWGAFPNFDQLRVFTAVPEPSTVTVLSSLALGGAVCGARRRRASRIKKDAGLAL
jgi:hypothetical protein